ncbi:MAG: type II toxin-antitoxin system RelE/ParE family toxin [Candidatus Hydrogenedentes bacterium]|nr:type II toxin-antitoxin system RelE/ParE family toxin [Candidatus Hydrogenedentota bacterium]MBI3117527.1 type II toxin-antitoxin system RelE/ParE family toxin [Candidatus Hydrogenedentota bacterium]
MRVRWVSKALTSLVEAAKYIEQDNPEAASHLAETFIETARRLGDFPMLGRVGRVRGTRELVVPRTRYIIAYRIVEQEVQIVRVVHTSRRWPKRL